MTLGLAFVVIIISTLGIEIIHAMIDLGLYALKIYARL